MGKSQHAAAKAARYAGTGDGDGEGQEFRAFSDGMTDVTYHTPAWHAARIEALTRPRMSYEEWKLKAKEQEGKLAEVAAQEEARQREYRALLDADRAKRLAKGTNHGDGKDSKSSKKKKKKSSKDSKKKKKSKDSKDRKRRGKSRDSGKEKRSSKDKKRKRDDSSSSSSSSSSSDSSSSSSSSSDSDADSGGGPSKRARSRSPIRLSEYMKS